MNPVDLQKAVQGYRDFREEEPHRAQRFDPKLPKAVWRMGACEFIGYMTTHRGEPALYVHYFAPGSRPILYAGPRRNQLYLFGGRFVVTAHGITDLDARGNITEGPPRYRTERLHNRRKRSRLRTRLTASRKRR